MCVCVRKRDSWWYISFTVTSRCRGGMTQSFYLLLHATDYCAPASLTVPHLLSAKAVCKPTLMIFFFSPSTGVVAVSDPRGPAADPPGPGLGASRGGALCGAGGLLTQQVGGLTPSQSCHHWNTFIALFTAYWLFLYLSLTSHLFISLSFAWVSLFYASSFDSALKNTRWPLLNFFSLF